LATILSAPTGLICVMARRLPGLTRWAKLFRPCGAYLHNCAWFLTARRLGAILTPVPAGEENRLGIICLVSRAHVLRSGFHNPPLQRDLLFAYHRLPLANWDNGETRCDFSISVLTCPRGAGAGQTQVRFAPTGIWVASCRPKKNHGNGQRRGRRLRD
jgi:hypothetical protein